MYKNAYMHGRLCTNTHKIPPWIHPCGLTGVFFMTFSVAACTQQIFFSSSSLVVACLNVFPTSTKRFLHFSSTHFWDFGCVHRWSCYYRHLFAQLQLTRAHTHTLALVYIQWARNLQRGGGGCGGYGVCARCLTPARYWKIHQQRAKQQL